MKNALYCPVVSTRDAEFRGFSELSQKAFDSIVPVIELTRSRRSKINPIGDIKKSLDRVLELYGSKPFVLDVSGLESQSNSQLSALLEPANGFENWVNLLSALVPASAIPVLHLQDDFDANNFSKQAREVLGKFNRVALRFPTSYLFVKPVLELLKAELRKDQKFIVYLDCGYVRENSKVGALARLKEMLSVAAPFKPEMCAPLASSFPVSVVEAGYGGDAVGDFPLLEVEISEKLKQLSTQLNVYMVHGDYSTIHPEDFTGTVTNWVPRVDFPLHDRIFYHRVRRPDGGYALCASRVLSDSRYSPINCWGNKQIVLAASGSPPGKSPSFWISVRLNIHIERQTMRLR